LMVRMPLPHTLSGTGVQGPPLPLTFGQVYPASTCKQSALQPSPPCVLLSSHASPGSIFALPHTQICTQGCPCAGHAYPGSIWQRPEQPSPGIAFLSSHASPGSTTPSPQ